MDLPILGQGDTGPSGPNGGGQLAAIDRPYAVELSTSDGGMHTHIVKFNRPMRGNVPDLGGIKDFDPLQQVMQYAAQTVHAAHFGVELGMNPAQIPVIAKIVGGGAVVWRHVTSFAFLGEWDPEIGDVVGAAPADLGDFAAWKAKAA